MQVIKIDGCDIMMEGDFHETIARLGSVEAAVELEGWLEKQEDIPPIQVTRVLSSGNGGAAFLQVKTRARLPDSTIDTMAEHAESIRRISPVMPVLGSSDISVP